MAAGCQSLFRAPPACLRAAGLTCPSHSPAFPEKDTIPSPWRQRVSQGESCDALGDREARCQWTGRQWEGPGLKSDCSHIFPVVTASLGQSLWFNFQALRKQVAWSRVQHGFWESWVWTQLCQQLPCDLGWPLASSGAHVLPSVRRGGQCFHQGAVRVT